MPRLLDYLRIASLAVSGVALVTLIAIFGWLVYGRYVLNATPTWVEQLSLLLVIWITFLGAAVGIGEDTHLSVEFVRDAASPTGRLILRTISDLLLLVFGVLMAYHCLQLAIFGWGDTIPLINVPEGLRSVAAVISGVLIVLFTGNRIVSRLLGYRRNGKSDATDPLGVE